MIAPDKLRVQRRVVQVLTLGAPLPVSVSKSGKALLCECGVCRRCTKRRWMQRYRAGGPRLVAKLGPRMDPKRKCPVCGKWLAVHNRTGFCRLCSKTHYKPQRSPAVAVRRGNFSHGGGI
jgi:hypothetical protein